MTVVRHGMMLVGPTGGGKTRVLRTLQAAVSRVGADEPGFETARVYRCNPKSVTMNQLYGSFDLQTGEWTDGVAAVLIRHISAPNTEETGVTDANIKWMVFDGPVDAIWIENMNTVLDDNKKLCLNSGEIIPLAEVNRIMFEVEDLSVASPATVSRCGMIYVEPGYLLPDRLAPEIASEVPLYKSWLDSLQAPISEHKKMFADLLNTYLVPLSELLRLELSSPIVATMPNIFAGLSRLIDAFTLKFVPDAAAEPNPEAEAAVRELLPKVLEPIFFLALIWSVGGTCDGASREKFDSTLRELMKANGSKVAIPPGALVYDATFDTETLTWKKWMATVPEYKIDPKISFQLDFNSIIVPTAATVCYTALLDTLAKANIHTIVVGPTGTAKSVVINQKLARGLDAKYEPIMMAFSAQTSANQTQDILDGKFEKRRQGVDKDTGLQFTMWGPMLGKQFIVFIDDFNMPMRETYGAQPPVELMRQMVDVTTASDGGWYDRKLIRMKRVVDVTLLGAMGPPGGGRQVMSNRMLRHLHMLSFTEMSAEMIEGIFTTITGAFLQSTFGDTLAPLSKEIVAATVAIYNTTTEQLRPTPAKPHYTFNLRDVSKVVQGVLMADKRRISEKPDLVRLWAHECGRVFSDRLINDDDRKWFLDQVVERTKVDFSTPFDKLTGGIELIYCDFFTPGYDPSIYEQVTYMNKLSTMMNEHLNEYNEQNINMNLVLFGDAIAHVCRIGRIIRQPAGNALLLGVGGSGRQSLTRLATHIADYKCFQIEITKNYRVIEWREDLKTVLRIAGVDLKPVVFLFVDTQITEEIFLENVNNILSAGEVPNLFEDADLGTIFEKMTPLVQQAGLPVSKTNLAAMFIKMVRRNLHVVMCMSPLGDEYRDRIRQFPSLINCCTIDWFSPWPDEALSAVARTLMAREAEAMDPKDFTGIVSMCTLMHGSVREKSVQYLEEMRRHNYVTSTSYLELINMIKMVMKLRQATLSEKRQRLVVGLDKLNSTKEIVATLKTQLAEQQPILEATTKQVEEQQVQIAKDKEDATVVKASAEKASAAANIKAAECKEIKESAENDLAEAIPALDAAVKCLSKLDKAQIVEVKALKKPPAGVRLTLKAICIMFEIKSVKITDPDNAQKKIDDYWGPSQKMLNDLGPDKFKQQLIDFDKDAIPESVIKLIDPVCQQECCHRRSCWT
jgi:dynein heavy chain